MASPVYHRQWFCRSCHPSTNPHSLPHLSSEAVLPSSVRQPSDCAPRKHVRTHSLEEAQTLKRESNNGLSLQRYKTQSHRSETIYLFFFFFFLRLISKVVNLTSFYTVIQTKISGDSILKANNDRIHLRLNPSGHPSCF